jgi:hypothetical protein
VLTLLALALLQVQPPADPCGERRVKSGVATYVVSTPSEPRAGAGAAGAAAAGDTIVTAVVCVRHAPGIRIGSYNGELLFDAGSARVFGVERPRGGMRVDNAKDGGRVRFAGAEPSGFADGMLLRVRLRVARAGMVPPIALQMKELNSTSGTSLITPKPRAR